MRSKWFTKYKLAHRGLHNDKYPENSLGAFENTIKHGFAIELDVRLLKDNTPVVIHDPNIERMCGIDKDVSDIYANELSGYFLKGSKYNIPTLKEVLELVNGQVPIMIELKPIKKNNGHKIEKIVYGLIKDYKGEIAVKSFNPFAMIWYRKNAPEIIRGMLSSYFENTNMPFLYKALIKRLSLYNFVKPDFISYDYRYLPNKYVSNKKIPVIAWTITSEDLEKEAMKNAHSVVFENYIPNSTKKATK